MNIKINLLLAALIMLLTGTACATAPQVICPDINEIKAEQLAMSELIEENWYVAYGINYYNTNTIWAFVLLPIKADSEDSALTKANEALSTFTAPGVFKNYFDATICSYDTGRSDVFAAAIKDADFAKVALFKQFINKVY